MHLFHKWEYFDEKQHNTFMGQDVIDRYRKHRRCCVCGIVQELQWDSQGGGWFTLDAQRTAIFNRVHVANVKAED
jgi:hypothetical protein